MDNTGLYIKCTVPIIVLATGYHYEALTVKSTIELLRLKRKILILKPYACIVESISISH